MKYIDAEKLIAEIKRRIAAYQKNFDKADNKIAKLSTDGRIASLKGILPFITSLQQEMELPDKYQTPDWIWRKVTIDQLAEEYVEGVKKCNDAPTFDLIHTAVCYGYELGLIARKEESK